MGISVFSPVASLLQTASPFSASFTSSHIKCVTKCPYSAPTDYCNSLSLLHRTLPNLFSQQNALLSPSHRQGTTVEPNRCSLRLHSPSTFSKRQLSKLILKNLSEFCESPPYLDIELLKQKSKSPKTVASLLLGSSKTFRTSRNLDLHQHAPTLCLSLVFILYSLQLSNASSGLHFSYATFST